MSIEIAETIRDQIKTIDKRALWAYGAEDFTSIDAGSYQSPYFTKTLVWDGGFLNAGRSYSGGLAFIVNGIRHKGCVSIFLNNSDYYDIICTEFMDDDGRVKVASHATDIFCANLVKVLDLLVEGIGDENVDDPFSKTRIVGLQARNA